MLQIGDKVKMNDKYYVSDKNKEKVFAVKQSHRRWAEHFVYGLRAIVVVMR